MNRLTSLHKVIRRMRNLIEHGTSGRLGLLSLLQRRFPPRVEQLRKVNEGKTLGATATTREMEDDGGFHGREQRVAGVGYAVVQEIRLVYASILGLGSGFPNDAGARPSIDDPQLVISRTTYRSIMSISAK